MAKREKFERSNHWIWRQREEQLAALLDTPCKMAELQRRAHARYRWSRDRTRQVAAFAEGRLVSAVGGLWRRLSF